MFGHSLKTGEKLELLDVVYLAYHAERLYLPCQLVLELREERHILLVYLALDIHELVNVKIGFIGVLVVCMEYSFMPATVLHLIADRSVKERAVHIFSLLLVIAAVIMKLCGIAYPPLTLVFWYFYIWFLYGWLIIRRHICAAHPDSKSL